MFDFLHKKSIRAKIYLGFVLLLLTLLVFEVASLTSDSQFEQNTSVIFRLFNVREQVKNIQINSLSDLKEFTNLLSSSNTTEIQNSLLKHEEYVKIINNNIDTLIILLQLQNWTIDLRSEINEFRKNIEEIKQSRVVANRIFEDSFRLKLLSLYENANTAIPETLLTDSVFIDNSIIDLKNFENRIRKLDSDFYIESSSSVKKLEKLTESSYILQTYLQDQLLNLKSTVNLRFLFLLLMMLLLPWFISNYLSKHFEKIISHIKSMSKILGNGSFQTTKLTQTGGIYGTIQEDLNQINVDHISLHELNEAIISGDYNTNIFPFPENSELGNSVRKMLESLRDVSAEREKQQLRDKLQKWHTEGMAKFSDILRQYASDTNILANELVMGLTNYVGSVQGALFIVEVSNDGENRLKMLAAYAYERKRHFEQSIKFGEGLIGSCAIEKKTIYLEEIPKNFVKIKSGLGDSTPRSLLIVPLKIDERLHGVLELASFDKFKPHEIKLIESLAENIASSLSLAESNAQTAKLLGETKNQAEELASQEEEMRQNLEEMHATREDALQREKELSGLVNALDNTLIRAEFDLRGNHISANENYMNYFEIIPNQLVDYNVFSFVPVDIIDSFKIVWRNVTDGIIHQGDSKRNKSDGNMLWMTASLTPILNENNKVVKVLFLASDITSKVLLEQEARNQAEQLRIQEEEIEKSFEIMLAGQEETDKIFKETVKDLKEVSANLALVKEILNTRETAFACFNQNNELIYANNVFEKQTGYFIISTKTTLLQDLMSESDFKKLQKEQNLKVTIRNAFNTTILVDTKLSELIIDSQKVNILQINFV